MTRNLALDLKPIRVNLVSPGAVDTELWKDFTQEQKKGFFKSISEKVPTGRVGKRKFSLVSSFDLSCVAKESCLGKRQGNEREVKRVLANEK